MAAVCRRFGVRGAPRAFPPQSVARPRALE